MRLHPRRPRTVRRRSPAPSSVLENFRRVISPPPTDCPWISEDGASDTALTTKKLSLLWLANLVPRAFVALVQRNGKPKEKRAFWPHCWLAVKRSYCACGAIDISQGLVVSITSRLKPLEHIASGRIIHAFTGNIRL